jgi:hypothetical protein
MSGVASKYHRPLPQPDPGNKPRTWAAYSGHKLRIAPALRSHCGRTTEALRRHCGSIRAFPEKTDAMQSGSVPSASPIDIYPDCGQTCPECLDVGPERGGFVLLSRKGQARIPARPIWWAILRKSRSAFSESNQCICRPTTELPVKLSRPFRDSHSNLPDHSALKRPG